MSSSCPPIIGAVAGSISFRTTRPTAAIQKFGPDFNRGADIQKHPGNITKCLCAAGIMGGDGLVVDRSHCECYKAFWFVIVNLEQNS